MVAADVYFHTLLWVHEQIELFEPLLRQWIGQDYRQYYLPGTDHFSYRPSEKFLISLSRNSSYNKTDEEIGLFRYVFLYIDSEERYTDEENLARLAAVLELLWANTIPAFVPGYEEELPCKAGIEGPVAWPSE